MTFHKNLMRQKKRTFVNINNRINIDAKKGGQGVMVGGEIFEELPASSQDHILQRSSHVYVPININDELSYYYYYYGLSEAKYIIICTLRIISF